MDEQQPDVNKLGGAGDTPSASSKRSWLKPALGYLFAAVCLVWVFHDVDVRDVWRHVRNVNPWWVAVAILCDVLGYVCQGVRWSLLLRPVGRVSTAKSTQAIYAGLFTNEALPLKAGELVRAYLIARWLRVKLSAIVPSMLVERLLDGIWLVFGLALAMIFLPLPRNLLEAGDALGIVLVIATGMFFYVIARRSKTTIATAAVNEHRPRESKTWKPLRSMSAMVGRVAGGVQAIGLSRDTYLAFAASFVLLLLQALSFWLVMYAYGLRRSFFVGAVVFLIVHLGTALPNAPANIGSYQFFTVVGLTLFGVDKTYAAGFSVVVFILLTLPLWLLGFVALSRSGTTLLTVREEISRLYAGGDERV
ncbi:MAG: flippase-like domain-containing protein [Pyrinomonadaceae bacterium]|nr:flippase-like domain-containing protein [Pyrinomonadaceae bacterium]